MMLLMISESVFCQSTEKIEIKVSTLDSMIKESEKCDSLRVAYLGIKASSELLLESNQTMFYELKIERNNRQIALNKIEEINKENRKAIRKKNNTGIWVGAAVVAGLVGGILISK